MLKHIYLVGFMGSGKSTIGPLLAKQMERDFHDLDNLIEKDQKITISEIFESRGEAFFRDLESDLLVQTNDFPPSVIALGGGTFLSRFNRDVVANRGVSVWLKIPFRLVAERCRKVTDRPLAQDPQQFESLFQNREPYYRLAEIQVAVEGKGPEQICAEIQKNLARIMHKMS